MERSASIAALLLCCLALPSLAQDDLATDPSQDDWIGERFVQPAVEQLSKLGEWALAATGGGTLPELDGVLSAGARFSALTPDAEPQDHGACRIVVDRNPVSEATLEPRVALRRWASLLHEGTRLSFKPVSFAALDGKRARTSVRVEMRGGDARSFAVAEWQVDWERREEPALPLIHRIRKRSADRVTVGRPLFEDRSSAVLGDLAADVTLARGADYWYGKIDNLGEPNLMGHHGLAVGDLTGDGLEDVYVSLGNGLPNKLLVRQADGTVRDTAHDAGVAWLDDTKGALIVDTDNDGDRDLVLAIGNTIVLAKNDGRGKFSSFVRMKAPTSAPFYSLSAADFDLDGDLDLYGVRYVEQSYGVSIPLPFHDANNGPSNHLMRNDGNDRFIDVTVAAGLDANNRRFSLAAAWADYDADGDPDLYVTNDFGRNNLYRNDGGRFVDVAGATGTEDQAAGMGADWADLDADGDLDLYVTNMYSAAGRRIAYQSRFKEGVSADERGAIQRHSLGNSLFVNDGGRFVERGEEAGVRMGRWGWGAVFVDWDNDADEDLLVPNGFVTGELEDDL